MSWLQPKLHLKVAQKQILTPGLVQMVSVLALNRLELREMITQEMVANPMLEEADQRWSRQRGLQRGSLYQGRDGKSPGDRTGQSL
jgi:DNA-directed RNA polymerase specialized sigma54-like protein